MDSYLGDLISGYVAELVSGRHHGYMGDDDSMGDAELGRRMRHAKKKLARHGYQVSRGGGGGGGGGQSFEQLAQSNPAMAHAIAQKAARDAVQMQVAQSGMPATAGPFVAATGQRKEPVNLGTATIAIALASQGVLQVQLQRAMQAEKLVLQASDSTTGADALFSLGIRNAVIGAHNLFNTPGVLGAATAFARDSWETAVMSVPLGQGGSIRVDLEKITATVNTTVASGTVFGTSAQG